MQFFLNMFCVVFLRSECIGFGVLDEKSRPPVLDSEEVKKGVQSIVGTSWSYINAPRK